MAKEIANKKYEYIDIDFARKFNRDYRIGIHPKMQFEWKGKRYYIKEKY